VVVVDVVTGVVVLVVVVGVVVSSPQADNTSVRISRIAKGMNNFFIFTPFTSY
jgi:hypothetical protein